VAWNGGLQLQWSELEDQACSVARTISVIGDRWTIMILRDCFLRVRRFDDFQERLGIGRPILADRLKKLVDAFVLTKVAYQTNPTRYEYRLTPKGLDLYPVIMSIVHWGDVHMAGKKGRPLLHHHLKCDHQFDPVMVCSECQEPLNPRDVRTSAGPGARHPQHLPADLAAEVRGRPANPAKAEKPKRRAKPAPA
jgi:DNA-binding HxlR family transcriptional regulator